MLSSSANASALGLNGSRGKSGLFMPYQTDAPIHHRPYGTVGLIAANVFVFFACLGARDASLAPFMLQYGEGLNPVQWVSSMFMHADLMHLLGNMIFLWCFGLIVEGKVGFLRFLGLYMVIGAGQCAFEQAWLSGSSGGSLGASSAIFGLLAVAVLWAPLNTMSCVWIVWFRPFYIDCKVCTLGFFYIGWELLAYGLGGGGVGSALLHLLGAAAGTLCGLTMLHRRWVDCEGHDLVSVMEGRTGTDSRFYAAEEIEEPELGGELLPPACRADRQRWLATSRPSGDPFTTSPR